MKKEELAEVLRKHKAWAYNESDGERANLSEANLRRADLSGANLSEANLSGANLSEADLRGAYLSGADGIHQFGPMPTSGRIIYAVRHDTTFMVKAGCFWGTLDELESKVNASHKCPFYLGIIGILRHQLTVKPTNQ